ncbi:MAG: OmpA family protein [Pseudomonadota bacterium]
MKYIWVIVAALLAGPVHAQWRMSFPTAWEAGWAFLAQDEFCELGIEIPEYAHARFVGAAGGGMAGELSFELQALRDDFAPGPVMVASAAPGWHPEAGQQQRLGTVIHIPGGGVVAHEPLARNMLHQLQRGYAVGFDHPTSFSTQHEVKLILAAKDLRPALDAFMRCLEPPRRISWAALSRARLTYEVDAHALSAEDKQLLRHIVDYVGADPSITRIFVDGHTDASGTKRHNNRLSQRRAGTVKRYLIDAGLDAGMIVERYHGPRYPVASNQDAAGKARNRRTTVRLSRETPIRSLAARGE